MSPRTLRGRGLALARGPADPARLRTWTIGAAFLLAGTVGAFLLGHLAASALIVPASLGRDGVRHAPDLIGRTLEEARERARDAGAGLDVLGLAYGEEADSGEVLFQYPPEGFPLEEGEPLEALVSAGRGRRAVPDVRGLSEAAALSLLKAAGIPVAEVRAVADDAYEQGSVVATEPEPGSPLGRRDSVVVAVSRGGRTVEVPDLRGRSPGDAAAILESAGLVAGETTREDDSEPGETVVVGQDPPAGGLARAGSPVSLRVARGNPQRADEAPSDEAPPPGGAQPD